MEQESKKVSNQVSKKVSNQESKKVNKQESKQESKKDSKKEFYMRRAIELAKQGVGWTNPNPMVGAVIVKDGEIIAEGYHAKCGELHAERNALKNLVERYGEKAKEMAKGATIYVTLEPCCHFGKQPPCTHALVEYGIGRVVIGSRDPNPLVSGKGTLYLREHGVEVEEDFMREECDSLNPAFFHYITTKQPYVVMKYAMTLDGKIATRTGASKWVTGSKARNHVHGLRATYSAIMVGIGTVLADDPMLNCRMEKDEILQKIDDAEAKENLSMQSQTDGGAALSTQKRSEPGENFKENWLPHQPLRVIVDSHLRIPVDSNIVKTAKEYPTVIACADLGRASIFEDKKKYLQDQGIEVVTFHGEDKKVDLKALMKWLGEKRIDSVLVEGGGQIHEAMLAEGLVDHVCAYVAPKLFGGKDAKTPVEGEGVEVPVDATMLQFEKMQMLGEDLLLEYDVVK